VKASVENDRIEIHDTSLTIDQGDFVIRDLPNGQHDITKCNAWNTKTE
jgi:hypothetical protein